MKKTVKLTEKDLSRIVKRVINEFFDRIHPDEEDLRYKYYGTFGSDDWLDRENTRYGQEKMDTMKSDSDYEDESFEDYKSFSTKYPKLATQWFGSNEPESEEIFKQYKEVGKKGPLRVRRFKKFDF